MNDESRSPRDSEDRGGVQDRPSSGVGSEPAHGAEMGGSPADRPPPPNRGPRPGRMQQGGGSQAGAGQRGGPAGQPGAGGPGGPGGAGGEQPEGIARAIGGPRRRAQGAALPAIRPPDATAPAIRAERVEAIRRDLVRRRRKKGLGVLARLAIFVVIPTLLVGWFLWSKASNLYRTEAVFVVQSAESGGVRNAGGGGALAALAGGVTDAVAVQNFILSRDVLQRLDAEHGLIAHYKDPALDWFHRLDREAGLEEAFEHYKRFTEVSFDPTEGVLTLSVVASDPAYAQAIARSLIRYSEEMVDMLSDPIRQNALRDADDNVTTAEERLRDAQIAAAEVRKELETFSVEGEVSSELNILTQMQIELEGLRSRLTNLLRVTSEDDPRVERLQAQVETLEAQIAARRSGMTGGGGPGGRSLADVNAELERANFEVTAAIALFTSAIEAREFARTEAQRQHRYLSVVVQPALPDRANFPKKAETTALAFLIFLGIYIISSLTISLIREQASI